MGEINKPHRRFSIGSSALTQARNNGYDDGKAGRESNPPTDEQARAQYLVCFRRGCAAREADEKS